MTKTGLLGRRMKAGDLKEERLCYLRSENKAADQLYSYCTADLQLCFYTCEKRQISYDVVDTKLCSVLADIFRSHK